MRRTRQRHANDVSHAEQCRDEIRGAVYCGRFNGQSLLAQRDVNQQTQHFGSQPGISPGRLPHTPGQPDGRTEQHRVHPMRRPAQQPPLAPTLALQLQPTTQHEQTDAEHHATHMQKLDAQVVHNRLDYLK